jgi:hypothetical protein
MARRLLESTRPLVSAVRNNIEIFATLAAIAAGALVPLPSPGNRGGGATHGGFSVLYEDARSDATEAAGDSDASSSMGRNSQAHSNSGQVRRWISTNAVTISIASVLE